MKIHILIFSVFLLLSACSSRQVEKPLIKTDEFLEQAKKDIDRTVELGPKAVIETDEKTVLWGDSEQDELPPVIETKTTTMTSAIKSTTKPTQSNWIKCDNRQGNKRGKK